MACARSSGQCVKGHDRCKNPPGTRVKDVRRGEDAGASSPEPPSEGAPMRTSIAKRLLLGLSLATLLASCTSPTEVKEALPTTGELKIVNSYSRSLYSVYFTSCESNSWGGDRMGADVIAIGASKSWTLSPGCWDVMIVAADNKTWINRGENLAAGIVLTLTPS